MGLVSTIFNKKTLLLLVTLGLLIPLEGCDEINSNNRDIKKVPIMMKSRMKAIFEETKLLCFGRYALKVPANAEIVWGTTSIPATILSLHGTEEDLKAMVNERIRQIRAAYNTAEITFNGKIQNGWQLRYFESAGARKFDLLYFDTYVIKGNNIFALRNVTETGQTEEEVSDFERVRANDIRFRASDEFAEGSGNCIDNGFIPSQKFDTQEMINVGFYFPSMPDVTFSISSNKDAYADYPKSEFEKMRMTELSLLARIRAAEVEQGSNYPRRTLLREGPRLVQHWKGEESMIRRTDGVHDFEWGFVGTPTDVANPAEFSVHMFTKVEHDVVGAAKRASVNDAEAVELWDLLLSGLKFRVKVPGAPEGSYYFPESSNGNSTQRSE